MIPFKIILPVACKIFSRKHQLFSWYVRKTKNL